MEKPVNLVSQRLRSSNAWLRQNSLYLLQLLRNMFIVKLHLQTKSRCLSKVACRGERDTYIQEILKRVHWDIRGSLIEGCVKKVMSFLINDKAPNDSPSMHNEEEVEQFYIFDLGEAILKPTRTFNLWLQGNNRPRHERWFKHFLFHNCDTLRRPIRKFVFSQSFYGILYYVLHLWYFRKHLWINRFEKSIIKQAPCFAAFT
jgi:hypothetical protein